MKVSVVAATFDRGTLLDRALHTYSKQTLALDDWEYVLVDDMSSDDTLKVCKHWQKAGLPLRVLDSAKDLCLPKQPGQWRDGCRLRNLASTFCFGEVLVSTHPEIMIPRDALEIMYETVTDNPDAWVTAIPYWLPSGDYDARLWKRNLHALRDCDDFWDPSWPDPLGSQIDYRNQNQEQRTTWESEVFWGMSMARWRWLGGFRNFDVWGAVDMDFLQRRLSTGIKTVIAESPISPAPSQNLMVYHQWHGAPRDMDTAFSALSAAGARYRNANEAREAGGLYGLYHHGPRERSADGTAKGVLRDHVLRYEWISEYVGNRDVLDVPAGTGYGASLLARAAKSVVGVDLDAESIQWGKRHYSGPDYRVGAMTALPVADASVDQAVCFEGIEHVPPEAQTLFVDELHRVLRPGGTFALSTPQRGATQGTMWDKYMLGAKELLALFSDGRWTQLDWFHQTHYGNGPCYVKVGTPPMDAEIMILGGTKR